MNISAWAKRIFFLTLLFGSYTTLTAQNYGKYWVFLKNKNATDFNPYEYFDAKAIERRITHNISLNDSTDWPVDENYISQIAAIADSTGKSSRWLNAIVFYGNENQAKQISELEFVTALEKSGFASSLAFIEDSKEKKLSDTDLSLLIHQTKSLGIENFESKGIDGKGIRIAIFDAGFPGVDKNPAFDHIHKEKRIVNTYDFVRNRYHVYGYNHHGTMVLSCIAGIIDGKKAGLATGAEFLLARTEKAIAEPFSEEENWLAAAEWADKNGAHIINSSLGYTYHRYFTWDMDGKKSLISRAANMAASKGILVVNAAGNDGSGRWKIIGTPADADSVLAIGGIDPETYLKVDFSSFGPTATKILKPNVSAFGVVMAANEKSVTQTQGTSFSSPLIAGFAACAWQMNPEKKNMEIFKEIERAGNLFPYFDYAHGHGMPHAAYFTDDQYRKNILPTFTLTVDESALRVTIKEEFVPEKSSRKTIEKKEKIYQEQKKHFVYYHLENERGTLDSYYVIAVKKQEVLAIPVDKFLPGQTFRVHYKGFTETYKF
jgi:serine protease AprX